MLEEVVVGNERKGYFIFWTYNEKLEAICILLLEIQVLGLELSGPHSPVPGKLALA